MQTLTKVKKIFEKLAENQRGVTTGDLVGLFLSVGVLIIVFILIGVLGGKMYNTTQSDINSISDPVIKGNINTAIQNSFGALKDSSSFVTIIVLTLVMGVVIYVLLGSVGGAVGGGYRNF